MISKVCFFFIGLLISEFCEILTIPVVIRYISNGCLKQKYHANFAVLLSFLTLYYTLGALNGFFTFFVAIKLILSNILFYVIGVSAVNETIKYGNNSFNPMIVAFACGMFLHAMLNIIESNGMNIFYMSRMTLYITDFFTKSITLSTYQSTLMVMSTALGIYYIYFKSKLFKIFGFIIIFLEAYVSFVVGSRSVIAIIVATVMITMGISFFSRETKQSTRFRIFLATSIIFIVAFFTYELNLFQIKDTLDNTYLLKRFTLPGSKESSFLDMSSRFIYFNELFKQLPSHLTGGIHLTAGASAHNVFLDVIRISGLLPAIFFLVFFITVILHLLQLNGRYGIYNPDMMLISIEMLCIMMIMMVESVFSVNRNLMYAFMFICGNIDQLFLNINANNNYNYVFRKARI